MNTTNKCIDGQLVTSIDPELTRRIERASKAEESTIDNYIESSLTNRCVASEDRMWVHPDTGEIRSEVAGWPARDLKDEGFERVEAA